MNKLEKILTSENVVEEINNNLEYLLTIIPDIKFMIGFEHKHPHHHLDVWNHTLLSLSLSENDFNTRLVLLLHDIGKPFMYQEDNGVRHYNEHAIMSSIIARNTLKRLGYDTNYIKKICYLIKTHDEIITEKEIKDNYGLSLLKYKIQYCDALAHHPDKLEKRIAYLNKTKLLIEKSRLNNLKIIAAIGKNNELGKNNDLIWPIKEDLKFFKELTTNHNIIMGYNTYLSLPNKLPNRHHIILTHRDIKVDNDIDVYNNKYDLLENINNVEDEIYIIGGASIYKEFIDDTNELILTEIEAEDKNADVYFPTFKKEEWSKEIICTHNDNNPPYKHVKYLRK